MKKIIFSVFIATFIIFGCKKDEVTPLEGADFASAVTGETRATAGTVAIDNYLTFLDISRNAIEHEWRIDAGNFFISDDFTDRDSVYTDFIIEGAGMVSTEKKVNILFTEPGLQPVQIINKFEKEPTDGPVTAVQQGEFWVIDTTYMIDVFDNLQPAFKVFKGADEVLNVAAGDIPDLNDAATWPVVEVEAGQMLTFVDVTAIGRPNKRTWNLEGAVPAVSQDSAATVAYFSLGSYVGGNFTSVRDGSRPEQNAGKIIPIRVEVIPSSEPFLYEGNLIEQADETITFNVGGEVAPFSGQEGAFTVHVVNDSASFDQNIPVQLAKVSDSDATKIELKLSAPIYNSDVITVSYAGTEIKSADFRTLSDFGPETVEMHFEDSLIPTDWGGFEVFNANWKKAFCEGIWVGNSNGSVDAQHFARTEDMFFNGVACMKLDLFNGLENKTLQGSDFGSFGLTAGDYVISLKVYLDVNNIMTTLRTSVQDPFTNIDWDVTNTPRGEWVELKTVKSFDTDLSGRYDFKIVDTLNPATTDAQILFIDDYQFIPSERRQ